MLIRFSVLVGAALTLASCETPQQYGDFPWKANASPHVWFDDLTDCQVSALERVPGTQATYTTPIYTTPATVLPRMSSPAVTNCTGYANHISCSTYGGSSGEPIVVSEARSYGGQVVTYDPNVPLREAATFQCMRSKGYQVAQIRMCTPAEAQRGVIRLRSLGALPAPSEILCAAPGGVVLR